MVLSFKRSLDLVRLGQAAWNVRSATDEIAAAHARRTLIERMGKLRGLPQKLGQILSMGSSPQAEDFHPMTNQGSALDFWVIKSVLEDGWGCPLEKVVQSISREGLSASLGQVHRATLVDGREVAIKVRYPGIEKAVASDLSVLGWLSIPVGNLRRGFDMASYKQEILRDIEEELDYRQEAANQQAFGSLAHALPALVVPEVVAEWSNDHILVTRWEEGQGIEAASRWPQGMRRSLARRLLLQFAHSVFVHGLLHADPHTGNYRFRIRQDEPEVVLYDFGSILRLTEIERGALVQLVHAVANDSDIDPYPLFLALGFDADLLEPVRAKLPALCRVLFEPFSVACPFDLARWNRAERVSDILGDDRWNFRMSGPARLVFLMRAFHGLVYYLEKLGEPINWSWHVKPLLDEQIEEARKIPLPPVHGPTNSLACLAKYLCIRVTEGGLTKVSVTLPASAVDDIEAHLEGDLSEKIRQRGHQLSEIVRDVRRRCYAPGELFDLTDGDKTYRVWLA